jgi:error-prone DNA polymerase
MAAWKKNGNVFKFKSKLIDGMQSRGYDIAFAEQIFKQICGFGEYGFPESHSASFAVLAYCSAWLKFYYPECFYASLLNSQPMGFYSPSQLVQDAQRHGVKVLPVCVNASQRDHIVVNQEQKLAIRLGLRQVKGLSEQAMESLVANRPYQGYRHPNQITQLSINRRDIELLASANAMHSVSGDRFQTRWALMDSASELPLFRDIHESPQPLRQPNATQDLLEDFTSTGISLNQHPISLLEQANKLGRFTHMQDLKHQRDKSMVTVVGVVTGKQSPGTAAGVTFFTLEDNTGNINVVVWKATARCQQQAYLTAKILKVKGIIEKEGDVLHVIAGQLIDLTDELTGLKTQSREFH